MGAECPSIRHAHGMRTKTALLAVGAVLGLGLFGVTVAATTVALTSGDDAATVAAPPSPSPSPSPSPPPSPSPSPSSPPSKTPLPSPPAVAKPSPSQPRIAGFSPRFVFDEMGCAEVPKRVLDEVNKHLPSEYRAFSGVASQWRGDSAVMTVFTERVRDGDVVAVDLYVNTMGALFDYNAGEIRLTDLPEHPAALDANNEAPMGLAFCQQYLE